MSHGKEVLDGLRDETAALRELIPEVYAGFAHTHKAALGDGALPTKAKELIAFAIAAGENRREFEVQLIDANGQGAQHVFVDRQLALHLLHGRRRGVQSQEGVVTLAVLLDAVGEVAKTPVLDLGDNAAAFFDDRLDRIVEGFGLLRRDILPRNDDVLVERHVSFSLVEGGAAVGG